MKIISQITSYKDYDFGQSLHMDIDTSDERILLEEFFIHNFVFDLIEDIGMKVLDGNLMMKYYKGRDHTTAGWSCMCFLDCSSFSMHTSPHNKKIYIDIFSCKPIILKQVRYFICKAIAVQKINFISINR